jgi:hypothetical protein
VPDNQPCALVSQCFVRMTPFRSMRLTLQSGLQSLSITRLISVAFFNTFANYEKPKED